MESLSDRIRKGNSTPADDRLADAAPDLLTACQLAVSAFGRVLDPSPALDALQAAIAKATIPKGPRP